MGDVDSYKRKPGIASVGDLAWGTHLGLFYQTKDDLLDVLIPYLKAGLESNEYCVWVVSSPLTVTAARKALRDAVADFDARAANRQIHILTQARWGPDGEAADATITAHVNRAYTRGFDGLRFAGAALPDGDGSRRFVCHGAEAIGRDNAIAVFAYPRDRFDAVGLMDVVKQHCLALVRNAGKWEPIESSEAHVAKHALAETEQKLHSVFRNMVEGFAYHRIVLDTQGEPRDYVFLEVNDAFEQLTALKAADVVGKRATEVLSDLRRDPADWIGKYGQVALTGKPIQFESYSQSLGRWYAVSAFCPRPGFFITLFSDVTARREAAEQLLTLNDELASSNEELRAETEARAQLEEELRAANEEMEAANEELRAQMDELEQTEHARRVTALFPDQNPSPVLRVLYDGTLVFANAASKRLLRSWRCPVDGAVPDEARAKVEEALESRKVGEIEVTCGRTTYAFAVAPIPAEGYANLYAYDVTARKQAEQNQALLAEILRLLNQGGDLQALIGDVLGAIQERTDFDAVGLRLHEGQDFPYYQQSGFSDEFIREENSICARCEDGSIVRDAEGNTVLECTCGVVLSGQADPSMSCFTENGSFWTAKSPELLDLLPEDDPRRNPRNRCIHAGYQTVGLVPVRSGREILGLLQLNARAEGQLDPNSVRFFELLADNIGLALRRKFAEDALRDSEQRLLRAQEIAHLGSWELDLVKGELTWSDEVYRIFGLEPQEFDATYEAFLEHVHPDDRQAVNDAYTASIRDGLDAYEIEHRVLRQATGEVRWVHEKCEHLRDEAGKIVRSVGMVLDVTERKQAEEHIHRQHAILEGMNRIFQTALACETEEELGEACLKVAEELTGSRIGFVGEIASDGRLHDIAISEMGWEACRIANRDRHSGMPRGFDLHGLYGAVVRDQQGLFTNEPVSHADSIGLPEGHAPLRSFLGVPLVRGDEVFGMLALANRAGGYRDEDLETARALAVAIVQALMRQRAAAALRASEQRYRSLFSGMTEGFALHEIVCDEDGTPCDYRFLDINPAFEQLTTLTRDAVVGRLVSEVLPGETDKWVARYAPVALQGESVHFDEFSPGLDRHFEIFAYRPAPMQFAVLFLDISERVRAEQGLQAANEKLQQQAEELAAINEELQTQTEELQIQAEELVTVNDELRQGEQSLLARTQELEAATGALKNEKLRLEAVLEALPVGMALTDTKGGTLRSNAAFEQVWRGPRPPAKSVHDYGDYKAWWADTGKALAPREWASIQAIRAKRPVVDQLLEIERFDGSRGYVLNSASPVRDANGKIVGAAVAIQDITDVRQAQQQVRDNEERLRLALEGGHMACWEQDFEDLTVTWSESLYAMLGLDPATTAASSEAFYRHVHPADRDRLERRLNEAIERETDYQVEFRVVRPDGQVVWLASRARIIRAAAGPATRMMGVTYDITPRKEMESELRRLNERLEATVIDRTGELEETVETLRDEVVLRREAERTLAQRSRVLEGFFQNTITPLAFMDKEFNFVRVNEAYAQSDEKEPQDFIGKNHFELYPSDENRAIFENVVRTKESYHAFAKPFAYEYAQQRGVSYWNWLLTPLLDEAGEVEYLVLNLEDVTARQLAFEELEARASQLQRLTQELSQAEDRERQRLAEVLHDDLQQLLVGAKLHLNILAGRAREDEELDQVVGQVRTLISAAINKSRGLSHELSPPLLQQGGLAEVLTWLGQQMLTTCGLTVRVDAAPDVDFESDTLRTFAYKAAQEMLFNVVKHARVKEARVELRQMGGYVRLVVSDEGQGFDPNRLGERSDAGFGLFSIQERVELLGGWMKFKSMPGKGSTFVLAIPEAGAMAESAATIETPAGEALLRSAVRAPMLRRLDSRFIRVLLVDDHKVMRQGLAALLDEQPDIEVVGQAGNGRDAVTLAGQLGPDVIVMDMAMPVLAGDDATRQIKGRMPSIRVIGLSLAEQPGVAERMLQAGCETFLSKTDPSEKLLAAIRGKGRRSVEG